MKCLKCEKEINDDCKFCSNCGKYMEEKPIHVKMEDTIKMASKVWYALGYIRAKSTKKDTEKLEEDIKKCDSWMFEWYKEVVYHLRMLVKENNEKNKKANGSKRTRISKIEKVKIK